MRAILVLLMVAACKTGGDSAEPDDTERPDTDLPPDTDDTDVVSDGDLDDDGWLDGEDCAPSDPDVHPGATEICDGAVDEDCDGTVDEPGAQGSLTWWEDIDGDGYGGGFMNQSACEQPEGYVLATGDCSDHDPDVNPGATEICDPDRIDQDCDGLVDANDPSALLSSFYQDRDGDGYGDTASVQQGCVPPADDFVDNALDCDDSRETTSPDGQEICDGLFDEDCDGLVDDADPSMLVDSVLTWYADADADGWGDAATTTLSCADPGAYALGSGDCDDGDGAIHPGAAEVCDDGKDSDCDGAPGAACGIADEVFSSRTGFLRIKGDTNVEAERGTVVGDLDGNGSVEVVVANGYADTLWLVSVDGTRDVTYADAVTDLTPANAIDSFGSEVPDARGDLDGDGLVDLSVMVTDYVDFQLPTGAYVFSGAAPTAGQTLDDAPIFVECAYYGTFTIGDFDADGQDDMAGACSDATTFAIYDGPVAAGTYRSADRDRRLTNAFSFSAASADFDGDGVDDLALVDSTAHYSGSWEAHLEVFYGPLRGGDADTDADAWWPTGNFQYDPIHAADDLTGDGDADLVATTTHGNGAVVVISPPSHGDVAATDMAAIYGDVYGSGFGLSVGFGDLDGRDDIGDLVVGAPFEDAQGQGSSTYVFYGPIATPIAVSSAIARIDGTVSEQIGYTVSVGDPDGNGVDDVFMAAPGAPGVRPGTGAIVVLEGGGF